MEGRFAAEVRSDPEPGTRTVALAGELDLAVATKLWEALEPLLDGAPRCLVLDLSDVEFMDSTALSVLVRAHRRLMHDGGELVIRRPSDAAARILEVTGLGQLFGLDPA